LPFKLSKQSLILLDENNLDYVFEEFPIGHGVSTENMNSMLSWLKKRLD